MPGAAATWRLFIAHPVPAAVCVKLQDQLAPYRAAHPQVRWTRPQTWHLTLLFLGSVSPERVPQLTNLVDDRAASLHPYVVRADRGGGRTGQGEGVAWLGLSTGAGALIGIATELAQDCPPDVTTGPRPRRTPSAHLTLARRADEAVVQAVRRQSQGPLGVAWRVDRLCLVRSHLEATGARYETLHEATL